MAMDNKWKQSASVSAESVGISFNETPAESSGNISTRTDWTMQRKVGVAMGVVGALLFVVGLAPMVLDSENLKGDLTAGENTEKTAEVDPLAALLAGSADENTTTSQENTDSVTGDLPDDLKSFGALGIQNSGVDTGETVIVPTPDPMFAGTATNTAGYTAPKFDPMTAEVDQILSAETINTGNPTNPAPIATPAAVVATNSNTGMNDTNGSAFANQGGTVSAAINAQNNSALHNSAGMNTSSVNSAKNTNLTNSGPADTALLVFLFSLFLAGGLRYRKELF